MKSTIKNKSIELWFVRHGETIFNKKGIVQGWSDSPLTKNGKIQTACLAKGLKNSGLEFSGIYSSDLTRCVETAEILQKNLELNSPIQYDRRLREINTGDEEGEYIKEHLQRYPNSLNIKKHSGTPNGETWDDVFERIAPAIDEIAASSENNSKVLIVSHSLVIASLLGYIDRNIEKIIPIPNNSVTIFTYRKDKLKLKTFSKTDYIKEA